MEQRRPPVIVLLLLLWIRALGTLLSYSYPVISRPLFILHNFSLLLTFACFASYYMSNFIHLN